MESAFAPAEHRYKSAMLSAAWGHLAPVYRKKYDCEIVFCLGCYREITVISSHVRHHKDGDLDGSPWYFQHEQSLVSECIDMIDDAGIYVFKGTYEMMRQNAQAFRFEGWLSSVDATRDNRMVLRAVKDVREQISFWIDNTLDN